VCAPAMQLLAVCCKKGHKAWHAATPFRPKAATRGAAAFAVARTRTTALAAHNCTRSVCALTKAGNAARTVWPRCPHATAIEGTAPALLASTEARLVSAAEVLSAKECSRYEVSEEAKLFMHSTVASAATLCSMVTAMPTTRAAYQAARAAQCREGSSRGLLTWPVWTRRQAAAVAPATRHATRNMLSQRWALPLVTAGAGAGCEGGAEVTPSRSEEG